MLDPHRDANLRPYASPGKFEGGLAIDEYAYALSLEGCDDECGSVAENGVWYGMLTGIGEPAATARIDLELTPDECAYLVNCAGCIVSENDQGFVSVEWYDAGQDKLLVEHWDAIASDMEETAEDRDEDY